ncbi:MAG: serine/threonine-protein kinase [Chloroflexota bacterium]
MSEEALVLGRYRLDERIATGGSAEVWRAHDTQLDRDVAVKLLHPHLLPDAASRSRLEVEARAVAALSHPGIVAIYDIDAGRERPALVLELVEGESLGALIARDGSLAPHDVARIGADVADALFHAHQRGVVHRDVKPSNILLDRGGRARLVDFGIAHSLADAAERLTLTGTIVGTPRYMAPEQLADGAIGPRTDLYALGAVMYEALDGRPAWESGLPVVIAAAQREGPPPLPDVDPGLAALVRTCLSPDPMDRPQTAGILAAQLRAWEPARPAVAPADDDATVTSSVVPPAPVNDAAPRPRRRFSPTVTLVVVAALVTIPLAISAFLGANRAGSPVTSVTPTPTVAATPAPTATPTVAATPASTLDFGTLSRPVQRAIERYREACGLDAPLPEGIESMNKKAAEDALDSLIEACQG